jgi:hypothetical protein
MQRIRAEAQPAATAGKQAATAATGARKAKTAAAPSRILEWFQWSPALALACGIVAVQFGIIAHMATSRGEEGEYVGVRGMKGRTQDAFVRVTFKPESTEIDLRALLREVNAEIVSGPSQLGDYYLVVRAAGVQSVLTTLQANSNVESAEIVRELPSRPM